MCGPPPQAGQDVKERSRSTIQVTAHADEDVEQGGQSSIAGGCVNNHFENQFGSFSEN